AGHLAPHREALLESWIRSLVQGGTAEGEARAACTKALDALLERLARGEVDALIEDEARAALERSREGSSLGAWALAIRVLDRCCLPFLLSACPEREALAECLLALCELGDRRLEMLLQLQEEESARRLVEAQEQAARTGERARETARVNEALRRAQAQSQHRADQIALLASVARRIAPVLDPERLMQVAAETIQARMGHTYVAVVVLDDEGVLVGRWAGRPGVGRRSGGRAQGPPGGIIGRALRHRSPQVVGDVSRDPDYLADVPGTRSEMVVPLLEGGAAVGAIDFQSERPAAFDLDDVAAGEALSEFLVVSLRNARLLQEARRGGGEG
ncbi:MAG TPA: GAF domain-containing protein, partial [Vicinamibacteria bacterium]|nr:GAF domain-containing protein [Vicinamibacteria bacterium]